MQDQNVAVIAFLAASSLVLLIFALVAGRRSRASQRLDELSGKAEAADMGSQRVAELARSALPAMAAPLVPREEEERSRLQNRLTHAGLYGRQAMTIFLGTKMLLTVGPVLAGALAAALGLVSVTSGLLVGACLSIIGVIGPAFWLDYRKSRRQAAFRRALPDALDIIVICLEGGLSLPAALRKVAGELHSAHPLLAAELNIAQREVQLGRSAGEAMRQFANRADLEEVRSLASVIIQSERYGASLVKSLRVHAESLRNKRLMYAEEMAHKAATKVLFPTVLCILPAMFIVILAPGVIQVLAAFQQMTILRR